MKPRMLNKMKSIIKVTLFAVIGVLVGGFVTHNYVNYVEKKQVAVDLKRVNNLNNKTVFFYRDDCPDCQSVFHKVYWHNVLKQDVVFVNMNNVSNRKYVKQYKLVSVPTFYQGKTAYTGTSKETLNKVLGD